MPSHLSHLEEPVSGERFPAEAPATVSPRNGRPLLARYDLRELARRTDPAAFARRPPDLWRFEELLPGGRRITLGEGESPVLAAPSLARALSLEALWIKDEGLQPTGSFKARGMAVAVSRAKSLGVRGLMVPSAGNAAVAAAAYAARAGLPLAVAMPRHTPPSVALRCRWLGAEVHAVEGTIHDCAAFLRARHGPERFDLSTLREPWRLEGKKTLGLELWQQMGVQGLPTAIVYPAGGGTGLIGLWKAFGELAELGWLEGPPPRLAAVQHQACAPVVRRMREEEDGSSPAREPHAPRGAPPTAALGLWVPDPLGKDLMLRALRETDGTAVAVGEEEIVRWTLQGTRETGCLLCPEGGAALAGVVRLVEEGWIQPGERVLFFNTAAGPGPVEVPWREGLEEAPA